MAELSQSLQSHIDDNNVMTSDLDKLKDEAQEIQDEWGWLEEDKDSLLNYV